MAKMFTETVWLPNVTKIRGRNEKKATVIGLTRFLCESEFCQSHMDIWKNVLAAAVNVLEDVEESASVVKDADEALLDLEQTGYEAGFSKLHFASIVPTDLLGEFPVARNYFVTSLSTLSSKRPGVVSTCSVDILG
jgi:exportin-2 (importin alpha re-exporter)